MAKYGQPILLDHQYAALAANSPAPNSASIVRRAIDRQPEENQSFHVKRAAWGCAGVTIIRCTALAPTLRGPTDLENTNAPARSWRFVAVGNNIQNLALIIDLAGHAPEAWSARPWSRNPLSHGWGRASLREANYGRSKEKGRGRSQQDQHG